MDWSLIGFIVVVILLIISGGHLLRLTKEVKDVVDFFSTAIADGKITEDEWNKLIEEAQDVQKVILKIIELVARKRG